MGIDPHADSRTIAAMVDDHFVTPEVPIRRPPRREGPKVLFAGASAHAFEERARHDLETFAQLFAAGDADRALTVFDAFSSWLACVVDLGASEDAMLALAEDFVARDETLPLLLVASEIGPALLDRAVRMGALVMPAHTHADGDALLLAFLRRAVRQRASLPDQLVRVLMDTYALTVQEARVVRLAIAGEGRAAIAEMLDISPKTYDRHAENVRDKTGRSLASLRDEPAEELLAELAIKRDKALARR
jgi:DNA-binding NarL/FixJ family response regulator